MMTWRITNLYKCLPDGAVGKKKKKVSVFDEGTAAKLSAHLDLPKRDFLLKNI